MLRWTGLAILLLLAPAVPAPAQGLTPLVVEGDRYFVLQWEAADHGGRPEVRGLVLNDYGFAARKVRLLVDSLDAAGAVTDQMLVYVPYVLTPGSRYYFGAPVRARAAGYRVQVFEWEWIQAGGGEPR